MAKPTWNKLLQQIKILERPGEVFVQPTVDEVEDALNNFEVRTKFRLPKSYREFILKFGPGNVSGDWFRLAAPIPQQFQTEVSATFNLDKEQEMFHDPNGAAASGFGPALLERLVLFAGTEGGDWFFWDKADVQDKRAHEYGVYYLRHEWFSPSELRLIAPSFKAFVADVCFAPTYPFSKSEREDVEIVHFPAWPTKRIKKSRK